MKNFSKKQVKEAARSALDNWDISQEQENNLRWMEENPRAVEVSDEFKDIWDWLEEVTNPNAR